MQCFFGVAIVALVRISITELEHELNLGRFRYQLPWKALVAGYVLYGPYASFAMARVREAQANSKQPAAVTVESMRHRTLNEAE